MASNSLTPKQEKFAQLVADGMTQADAYRGAYGQNNMNDNTLTVKASKLMATDNVRIRVTQIKEQLANKALWTREDSVRILKEVIDEGRAGDKTSAVKELNLMHGFNAPTKVEHTGEIGLTHKVIWE